MDVRWNSEFGLDYSRKKTNWKDDFPPFFAAFVLTGQPGMNLMVLEVDVPSKSGVATTTISRRIQRELSVQTASGSTKASQSSKVTGSGGSLSSNSTANVSMQPILDLKSKELSIMASEQKRKEVESMKKDLREIMELYDEGSPEYCEAKKQLQKLLVDRMRGFGAPSLPANLLATPQNELQRRYTPNYREATNEDQENEFVENPFGNSPLDESQEFEQGDIDAAILASIQDERGECDDRDECDFDQSRGNYTTNSSDFAESYGMQFKRTKRVSSSESERALTSDTETTV